MMNVLNHLMSKSFHLTTLKTFLNDNMISGGLIILLFIRNNEPTIEDIVLQMIICRLILHG